MIRAYENALSWTEHFLYVSYPSAHTQKIKVRRGFLITWAKMKMDTDPLGRQEADRGRRGSALAAIPPPQKPEAYHLCMLSCFSRVWPFVTPWTVAQHAPLSMGFSRQEYWSGLSCPPPRDLPNPGIKPIFLMSPILAGRFFTASATITGILNILAWGGRFGGERYTIWKQVIWIGILFARKGCCITGKPPM